MSRQLTSILVAALVVACGSRTDIGDKKGWRLPDSDTDGDANGPPEAICPEEAWASPGKPAVLYGDGEDDVGIATWSWSALDGPLGWLAQPHPSQSRVTSFDPDLVGDYTLELVVGDAEGLVDSCEVAVHSVVGPPVAFCPDDMTVEVDRPADLHGDGYDDNWIEGFRWEILSAPPGSVAELEFADLPDARITPDVTGTYRIRLTVVDNEGLEGSCEFDLAAGGVPTALCPDDMEVPTRTTVSLHGDALDDGTIVSWSWLVLEHDTDTDPVLGSPGHQDTTFWALRVGTYRMQLAVVDDDGLSGSCEFTIVTTPTGPSAICPPDIDTTPLTEVELVGDGEDDGRIVGWRWSVVSRPTGSSAPGPAPDTAQVSYFMPDVAGEYRIRLTVTDDDGLTGSCEFSVNAIPSEGLRVELYWNPPESPSDPTDVDLHLLHPTSPVWFDDAGDCYYANCNASASMILEWDVPAFWPDNPRLDIDDVEGYGPENINIDNPVTGSTYTVGVHYFSDDGWGPSQVYVKIYCGTVSLDPVFEIGPVRLTAGVDYEGNDFWKVADVTWDGYDCEVRPIDVIVSANDAMAHR